MTESGPHDAPAAEGTSAAPPRARRPRRERGLTESLLSIMLVLEICVLFFVILNAAGAHAVSVPVAWFGGLAFIVVMGLTSGVLRYRWGVIVGCALQVLLLLTGLLVVLMWVVGAIFVGLWIFCLVKGIQIDRRNDAYRAWLAANPDAQV
ncbi:DUF4233 domain-containing protein [Frondihabitans cladoniiphilus]|uniref:DUF4233 domain-containing protein n=1 Tax=Frondihabitans cladoniiphilus TaxID=715785 RepID=A0ABP8VQR8_9MICO